MKRLRSSEDLHSYGEKNGGDKNGVKDSSNLNRSFSSTGQRSFYYKQENVRKSLISSSSSSRYERDRTVEEDREGSRLVRKRSEHDFDGFDRRKGFDRDRYSRDGGYSGGADRNIGGADRNCGGAERNSGGADRNFGGAERNSGGGDRNLIHRSESFCGGSRREFPKGFRSERDRSRREGSVSSWRRGLKDFDESSRGSGGGSRVEERVVRSPKGFSRDVKSPSWSKDSESEQSKKRNSESPRVFREVKSKSKSPSVSKDSESEQSKSVSGVEVKKSEEMLQQVQSGSGSEMEEGELEPEPVRETELKPAPKDEAAGSEIQQTSEDKQAQKKKNECHSGDADVVMEEKQTLSSKEEAKCTQDIDSEVKVAGKEVCELPKTQDDPTNEISVAESEIGTTSNVDDKKNVCLNGDDTRCKEEMEKGTDKGKAMLNEEEREEDNGVGGNKPESIEGSTENDVADEVKGETMESVSVINNVKDKGKSISVTPDVAHSSKDGLWIDRGSNDLATCPVDDMEGPSRRGFELFSTSPVRKAEKSDSLVLKKENDDSLAMGQLDLSLSLPNVLLPIGAQETATQAPGSPSQARSVQSLSNTFCTNSDGFTASMSFSGSQSLYHNPSCSLTKNSVDYEQSVGKSVGSRPLFQGFDWQALSQQGDPKQKEVPSSQRTSMNGNGSLYQPQASWGVLDTQALKGQHSRALEGSSKMGSGLEKQLSFHKQISGQSRRHDDVRSPTQSVGSHDNGSNYSFEKKRERSSGGLHRTTSQKGQEQLLMGGLDFVKTIIARIISESVPVMSRKFHEMSGQYMTHMKEGIRELMLNADSHGQILAFQKILQNRSDITLDVLVKCHRVQLEILVAIKTGLAHYLHLGDNISSNDLAQVFLNLKCRNVSCRSQLPVDECDCKLCVQKNGFCRECMCLVCSKFDNASNTVSWVGCDVCLHWCHTDCGLRESYIRNGNSTTGTKGTTEMQFHCIACDHPSEMFGFVKEVFQNFAKEWSAEYLYKELEYVKRIFSASKDIRGRQLHEIADQMLPRLTIKSNLPEVLRRIMSFLSDCDSSKLAMTTNFSGKEQGKENSVVAGPSQEAAWLKSIYSDKAPLLERPASILPRFDQNDKRTMVQELQLSSVQKDFGFDELDSIIKIKHAEAKMFQTRADDARREAEGLKRIALAKNEKIEEEYVNRITKLRFTETDEMRKRKLEELHGLERAHREYLNMKMRMESEIKDLLSKMEATKMNLAM